MGKTDGILQKSAETLDKLNQKLGNLLLQQASIVENYDLLLQNQQSLADNNDIVVQNQKTIIKNQGIITSNQASIIHNQTTIVKNQAYLKTFLYTQAEILSLLTQRSKEEISAEIQIYFELMKQEATQEIEKPIGE
jgi:hypothetical protein